MFMYIKKKLLVSYCFTRSYTRDIVLEAGLEPAQPQWPKDFKSFVSTIPPFELPYGNRLVFRPENWSSAPDCTPAFGVRYAHYGVFTWRGNLFSGAKIALIREKTTVCFCEFCFRRLFPTAHTADRALRSLDGQCVLLLLQKK